MGFDSRDDAAPQFTDHCFTGDYTTPLIDQEADKPHRQLSLLAETA
jgi:amidophosphoribosyltransferase